MSFKIVSSISGSIRGVVSPISELANSVARGEADLRVKIETKSKNELNQIADAVNVFIEAVRNTIGHAKMTALENASVSTELAQTSFNIGRRVEEDVRTINHIFEDTKAIIGDVIELAKGRGARQRFCRCCRRGAKACREDAKKSARDECDDKHNSSVY